MYSISHCLPAPNLNHWEIKGWCFLNGTNEALFVQLRYQWIGLEKDLSYLHQTGKELIHRGYKFKHSSKKQIGKKDLCNSIFSFVYKARAGASPAWQIKCKFCMSASSKRCSTQASTCSGLEDLSWVDHRIYNLLIWNEDGQQHTRLILTFNAAWNLQLTRAKCQTGQNEVRHIEHKFNNKEGGWLMGSEK